MKNFKNIILMLLAAASCLSFAACGSQETDTSDTVEPEAAVAEDAHISAEDTEFVRTTADGTFTIGVLSDINNFDPTTSTNFMGRNLIYEPLFYMDEKTEEISYVLAESYEFVDDSHIRIVLRDDAYFSNGEPVTSEDVYWSWYRMLDTSESMQYMYIDFDNWENVSDKEFIVAYYETYAPAIYYMANYFVACKSAMENASVEDWWNNPIGSGPYTLVENVEDAYMVFELNEDYWNPDLMPDKNMQTISIKKYGSSTSMMIDFQTGALDACVNVDASDAQRVLAGVIEDASYDLFSCNYVYYIAFPEYTESVSDVRVRQALNYAIDKEAVVQVTFNGLATTATSAVPSNIMYAKEYDVVEYNPELAKELLKEAGVTDLTLNVYYVDSTVHTSIFTMIQAYWAEIGVTLNLNACDKATFVQHMLACETDIAIYNGSPYGLDPHVFLQCTYDSTNPTIRVTDDIFNDAVFAAAGTLDSNERAANYEVAQDYLHDTYKNIYIAEPMQMNVYHSYITQFVTSSERATYFRFVEWAE